MRLRFRRKHEYAEPADYRIIVDGFLDEEMSDFLGGMHIESVRRPDQTSITTLTGRIRDQAELNGVVNSIYEMHLTILSIEVQPIEKDSAESDPGMNGE